MTPSSTHPPVQWEVGLFPGGKVDRACADHLPCLGPQLSMGRATPGPPLCA